MPKKKYLVIQTAFLGDLVLTLPFLQALKKKGEVVLIVRQGLAEFALELGFADQVFEVKKGSRFTYKKIIRQFRNVTFDTLFCPHPSLRSALFSFQYKAHNKVGFKNYWNFLFFNIRLPYDKTWPEAIRLFSLIQTESGRDGLFDNISSVRGLSRSGNDQSSSDLGGGDLGSGDLGGGDLGGGDLGGGDLGSSDLGNSDLGDTRLIGRNLVNYDKYFTNKDYSYLNMPNKNGQLSPIPDIFKITGLRRNFSLNALIPLNRHLRVAIFPGSQWETKKWTKQGFVLVIRDLLLKNIEVTLMGSPSEITDNQSLVTQVMSEDIVSHSYVLHDSKIKEEENKFAAFLDLTGQLSIAETVNYLKTVDLCLSNDSGGGHLASLAQVPIVSIFGPTVTSFGFRPWADRVTIVQMDQLACRPCGPHGHSKCPLGHHHCMTHIDPLDVVSFIHRELSLKR